MTTEEYIKKLRWIADFYEKNPELQVPLWDREYIYVYNKEDLQSFARALGNFEKMFDDGYARIKTEYLTVSCPRGEVCERKVIGKKFVEDQYTPGTLIPGHEEDIVEWDCGSIFEVNQKEEENVINS